MKILVISPVYSLAGVPLAQLRLAKSLGEIGHDVDLIYGCKKYNKIEKAKNIRILFFNKYRVIGMLFPLIVYLIFNKPKVIFSAEDHLNVIVVLAKIISFSNAKISTSSRVTPIDTYKNFNMMFSKGWFLKKLFPLVHWKADVMTCVANDMVKQYKKIFKYTRQVGVYNIVQDKDSTIKMKQSLHDRWFKKDKSQIIVASGKLAKWKGFDLLINAAKYLDKKNLKFKIVIIGGGPEKKSLNKMIKLNNLEKKIRIISPVTNTLKYFYNADIFVLSSRVEGMPNVMIEAMMCGCTIVATNCPTGPKEIIRNNIYGYLSKMNDSQDLSKNIIKAFNKKISPSKTDKILKKFSSEKVIKKHFSLLKIEKKYWKIN